MLRFMRDPPQVKMRVDAMTTAVAVASLAASGLVPQAPVAPPAPRTPALASPVPPQTPAVTYGSAGRPAATPGGADLEPSARAATPRERQGRGRINAREQ